MKLHDYQQYAVNKLLLNPKFACFLDMGLGKTAITLHAINTLIASGQIHSALVICPVLVMDVWQREAETWNLPLRVVQVQGTPQQREQLLRSPADVYVVSRDSLGWLFTQDVPCNMLVCDESSSFKHRDTLRFASLTQLSITYKGKRYKRKRRLIDQFDRVVLLSGTPCEHYDDLWAQIYLLDRGQRLDTSITRFKQKYMVPENMGQAFPIYRKMKPGAVDEINRLLADICMSMDSDYYLQLPERTDIVRYTGMCDKRYRTMERDGVIQVDGVYVQSAGISLWQKLQQIGSGFIYDEHGVAHTLNHSKEQCLMELLEGTNEQVVILYRFDYERKFLESIGGIALDNSDVVQRFKDGLIRIALLYPASGGKGLTLTNARILIWYTLPLSLEDYVQSIKRVHRQSQTQAVFVYHLISRGTIDEHIYDLLQKKKEVLDGLMLYYKVRRLF